MELTQHYEKIGCFKECNISNAVSSNSLYFRETSTVSALGTLNVHTSHSARLIKKEDKRN